MPKIKKTYLDFTAYIWRDHKELDPSYVQQCKAFLDQLPRLNQFQAASDKPRKCKNCSKPVDSFYHLNPLLCNETNNKPQAASSKPQALDKVK